jgi:hypothetical protein
VPHLLVFFHCDTVYRRKSLRNEHVMTRRTTASRLGVPSVAKPKIPLLSYAIFSFVLVCVCFFVFGACVSLKLLFDFCLLAQVYHFFRLCQEAALSNLKQGKQASMEEYFNKEQETLENAEAIEAADEVPLKLCFFVSLTFLLAQLIFSCTMCFYLGVSYKRTEN